MNPSPAMQRYAAEIYRLQQDHPQVPIALLTEQIDASAQATAQMVRRLHEAGFLVHEPYRGVRLTAAGEHIAMPALRRQRLSEVFLVQVMGYDWATAHQLAPTFQQGLDPELEDRIDKLTGHPTRCPRGEPIPSKTGALPPVNDISLIEVPSGSECVLSRVRMQDLEKLRYIGSLGLFPGEPFHLLSCAPFRGPLRLQMKRYDHVISFDLARALWVEVTRHGEGNKAVALDQEKVRRSGLR
ncbi:MAG: metal-dependent transcriptional regulator [Anaerolineaceae bacterium]|jgi:DtxR family Mn-dependent transcriptional regulator|nr:metal-dependent transcriptional regulator [Anaerolineaceae bacterium]